MKCIDAARSPLRQKGIHILNYLNDWLVLARSHWPLTESCYSATKETMVDDQPAEGSSVTQTAGCLSGNDFILCPNAGIDHAGTIPDYSAISGISQTRKDTSPEDFSEVTLPHGASYSASILAQSLCSILCLASGRFYDKVNHCCVRAVAPWTTSHLFQTGVRLGLTSRREVVTTDASNSGRGALLEGNLAFGS